MSGRGAGQTDDWVGVGERVWVVVVDDDGLSGRGAGRSSGTGRTVGWSLVCEPACLACWALLLSVCLAGCWLAGWLAVGRCRRRRAVRRCAAVSPATKTPQPEAKTTHHQHHHQPQAQKQNPRRAPSPPPPSFDTRAAPDEPTATTTTSRAGDSPCVLYGCIDACIRNTVRLPARHGFDPAAEPVPPLRASQPPSVCLHGLVHVLNTTLIQSSSFFFLFFYFFFSFFNNYFLCALSSSPKRSSCCFAVAAAAPTRSPATPPCRPPSAAPFSQEGDEEGDEGDEGEGDDDLILSTPPTHAQADRQPTNR